MGNKGLCCLWAVPKDTSLFILSTPTETPLEELLYRAPACPLAPFLVIANVITKLFLKSTWPDWHRERHVAKVTQKPAPSLPSHCWEVHREMIISHTGNSQGKDSLDARPVKCSTAVPMAQLAQAKYRRAAQWHGMG